MLSKGRDVIGVVQTGGEKTLGFVLHALTKLCRKVIHYERANFSLRI